MVFTNLAPNTEHDDAALALRLLFQPWNWHRGIAAQKLELLVAAKIGASNAISFESGRTALLAILTALGIGAGDEVLVQAYTCVAVPDPILWVGATPIYVDCDQTLTMSPAQAIKKITPRTKAIIIQHTFGMPANLEQLLATAQKQNITVIEDCAHALGASYRGKPVGSFGDAAFFSFGRDKSISSVFGGMATTSNAQLAEKIRAVQKTYPQPSGFWIRQQLLHPVVMWFAKKKYQHGGKALIGLSKKMGLTSRAVYSEEKSGSKPSFVGKQLANALATLALHQFAKLEIFNAHRRELAAIYEQELKSLGLAHQQTTVESEPSWLRYTIWSDKAGAITEACKAKGILLGDWYDTVIAPRGVNYEKIQYALGSCPVAERIASGSVNLPTDINTSTADAKSIVAIIKNVYATYR